MINNWALICFNWNSYQIDTSNVVLLSIRFDIVWHIINGLLFYETDWKLEFLMVN